MRGDGKGREGNGIFPLPCLPEVLSRLPSHSANHARFLCIQIPTSFPRVDSKEALCHLFLTIDLHGRRCSRRRVPTVCDGMRGGKTSLLPPQSAATRNPSHRLFGNRDGQVKERTGRGIEESLAVLFCPPGSFIFRRAANRRRGFSFGSVVPCALDSMDAEIIECWQSWDRNRGSSHCRWFFENFG